jgi:hypothetical protein
LTSLLEIDVSFRFLLAQCQIFKHGFGLHRGNVSGLSGARKTDRQRLPRGGVARFFEVSHKARPPKTGLFRRSDHRHATIYVQRVPRDIGRSKKKKKRRIRKTKKLTRYKKSYK